MVTYRVRYVDYPTTPYLNDNEHSKNKYPRLPIIVGPSSNDPRHSYSPLVAIINALLIMNKVEFPRFGITTISSDDIVSMLCKFK